MDNELDKIKKRKLEMLKQQQEPDQQQEQQVQQQIAQLESAVKQIMTKGAIERYSNLKIAHPEKAVQLTVVLAQLMQEGRISSLNNEQLKQILIKLNTKKDIKITRK